LITSATALACLVAKARSSVLAMPASVRPGRNGVTAPITPDSRTTGTTAASRRNFAGMNCLSLSMRFGNPARSLICSLMPLPRINHFLSRHCHWKGETPFFGRKLFALQMSKLQWRRGD
jgi:hypothetical protein